MATNKTALKVGQKIYRQYFREVEEFVITGIKAYDTVIDITLLRVDKYGKSHFHAYADNRKDVEKMAAAYSNYFVDEEEAKREATSVKNDYDNAVIAGAVRTIARLFRQ